MSREAYQTLIFDRVELEVLLNLSGCQRLYGFFGEAHRKASKKEVYIAVASLSAKGCLIYHQGKTIISQNIKILLEDISHAAFFLKIMQNTVKQQEYICYFTKENVIVSFCSVLRENAVTLVEMEKERFFQQFIADLLLDISEEERWNLMDILAEEIQPFFREALFTCEIWKRETLLGKICLMEYMCSPYILIDKENRQTKKGYKPEIFEAVLKEMISEE